MVKQVKMNYLSKNILFSGFKLPDISIYGYK